MPYTNTTWGTMKDQLANRLGDPSSAFWTADELGVYLTEALHMWGAAALYWRERASFNTVNATPFYALDTRLASLLGFTVTDQATIKAVQYSLLESAAAQDATWTPTEMYTMSQVSQSLNNIRDRFMTDTGLVLNWSLVAMPAPPIGRVQLPSQYIDVRRASWLRASDSTNHILWREDEWGEGAFDPLYETSPTTPYAYTVTATRPLELFVAPPPDVPGTLDIIITNAGSPLNPALSPSALGIPNNCAPCVKWGVLADLTKGDGQETDVIRMEQATKRWRECVEIAKMQSALVNVILNGSAVLPATLFDLDAAYGNWQDTTGTPVDIAIAGYNIIATRPVADGIYSITCDVVRNAPIPTLDADFIQVGLEEQVAILDYAEYAALYKIGGDDLVRAETRMQSFYNAAMQYNAKLRANALFKDILFSHARREADERPRRLEVAQ